MRSAFAFRAGGVPEMEKLDGYLRIKEAAEFLGVSPNTLRNWGGATEWSPSIATR